MLCGSRRHEELPPGRGRGESPGGRHARRRRGRVRRDRRSVGLGQEHAAASHGRLDAPTSGDVLIDGAPIARMSDDEVTIFRRRSIGFVFQFFNLLPTLSAEENVALPLLLDGKRPRDVRDRVAAALDAVGLGAPRATSARRAVRAARCSASRSRGRLVDRAEAHPRRRADRQPRLRDRRPDPRSHPQARIASAARPSSW